MTPASQKTTPPQTPTVFVVDDDPAICNFICGVLGNAGYPCQSFSNAQAFLDALDINAAGCILLDIKRC
jgi:FixJ family two-component response regulator